MKIIRESKKLTQTQMANSIGVALRSYQYYEAGKLYPKDSMIYQRIADLYDVSVENLLSDKDLFIMDAERKYGSSGREQVEKIVNDAEALFAGGSMSAEDEAVFWEQMMLLFDKMKKRHATGYTGDPVLPTDEASDHAAAEN